MPLISQETTLRSQSLSIYFALQISIQKSIGENNWISVFRTERMNCFVLSKLGIRAVNSCMLFFFVDVTFMIGFHSSILMSVSSLKIAQKETKNEP